MASTLRRSSPNEPSSILRKTLATSKSEVHVLLEATHQDQFDIRTSLELSPGQWKTIWKILREELANNCKTPEERAIFWTDNTHPLPTLKKTMDAQGIKNLYQGCFHRFGPDEVRKRIVKLMGDKSRIELFARQKVKGWASWGNEI